MSELGILTLVIFLIAVIVFIIVFAFSVRARADVRLPFNIGFKIDARPRIQLHPGQVAKPKVAASRVAWLAVKQRGRPDWRYPLDARTGIYIGHGADNQVALLHDPATAARHAVIYFESNRFYLNNLAPQGTYINGRLVTKQVLGDGNTIRMGNTKVIFHERRR